MQTKTCVGLGALVGRAEGSQEEVGGLERGDRRDRRTDVEAAERLRDA